MEFSVPGFIKRFCTPNAMLTLAEYLVDYAPPETAEKGWAVIRKNMEGMSEKMQHDLQDKIERVKNGERDIFF